MNAITMFGCLACVAVPLGSAAQCCDQPPDAKQDAVALGAIGVQSQDAIKELAYIYPLDTCPVSGEKLGSMGDPVVKTYEVEGQGEREVRFCCEGCVDDFEKDQAKYWKEIDEAIVEQQKEHYPLETCIVMGDPLSGEGAMGEPVDYVYRNRLVRLCCDGCIADLEEDPEEYLAKLDEAIVKAEKAKYPLKTCVVSGEELGSMGAPVEVIAANRLMLLCCKGCTPGFKKDPAKSIAAVEKAWTDAEGEGGADDSHPAREGAGGGGETGGHGGHGGGER